MSAVLSEFARTLATDFPIQAILDQLVHRIVELLPVTAAGVTLIAEGKAPHYIAASDASALHFEKLLAGFDKRLFKAADFPRDFRFRQIAPVDDVPGAVEDKNFPPANAGGNGDAAIHLFSLKLS